MSMQALLPRGIERGWYLLKRPFVYFLAFWVAITDCLRGEIDYKVCFERLTPSIYMLEIDREPILFFEHDWGGRHILGNIQGREEHIQSSLRQYWNAQRLISDGTYRHKPDFWRTVRILTEDPKARYERERAKEEKEAQERMEQVRAWLDAGGDVNAIIRAVSFPNYNTNRIGWSLLMLAVNYNEKSLARLLLQRGADMHYVADDSTTALSLAQTAEYLDKTILRMLQAENSQTPG